ncbi:MAG: Unknown protein [uncultured Sulfurovum sp.]|uniref:Arsenical-resistance protein ACR3 n=1 Tax=uncultured Sulfurovum sp. TaxID=269237 RepID=A0A6S6TBL4_9BACT|nr:MAG: Unknown protein [uncultured Sulfurovum sp.]
MQLIIIVILGAVLGFIYGFNTDGFYFSSNICFFAGLTLIMPSLFKFELKHISLVWKYKKVVFKGLMVNYLLLPIIAMVIGFVTGDFGIAAGLFLLSILSGGGMVMHWIKHSKGDISFGFLLLFINLLLISVSLLMLHIFGGLVAPYFEKSYNNSVGISQFVTLVIVLLIVIPFIASRIVRLSKPILTRIQTYQKHISQISIFIILFYLFGLQNSQTLVDIYDFEPELFFISFVAVLIFYLIVFWLSKVIYNLDNAQERAVFWHSITRYLTLALVIATFSVNSFGISMLLPIMFAYIVQIPLSVYISQKHLSEV